MVGHWPYLYRYGKSEKYAFYHMLSFTNEWHVASLILRDINYRIDFVEYRHS